MSTANPDDEVTTAQRELEKQLGDRYAVRRHLGTGGAGVVFEVTHLELDIPRVAKILRPSARTIEKVRTAFLREARTLATLRHRSLVIVFDQTPAADAPYFIMEFVPGAALGSAAATIATQNPGGLWVPRLRSIFIQLADVLAYLHDRRPTPLLHLDIKPQNVIVSDPEGTDPIPVLLDFGVARLQPPSHTSAGLTQAVGTFDLWPRRYYDKLEHITERDRAVFLINRALLTTNLDLHLLGRTILLALAEANQADPVPRSKWGYGGEAEARFLEETAHALLIDDRDEARIRTARSLLQELRRLESPATRIRKYCGAGVVRLPNVTLTSFGPRVRSLTDWPGFQRLRGVSQLGLVNLVYPGASHSRLEHALGVFDNVIEMLEQLSGINGDSRFRTAVSDEELLGAALVGLLHDVGHYPFAHQFRYKGDYPRHERRTLTTLRTDEVRRRVCGAFNEDVYSSVVALMEHIVEFEDSDPRAPSSTPLPPYFPVLRAVISGSVDADKLDYVDRDAHHAGVPYGRIVDRGRFISALRIHWSQDGQGELVLSDKGRVCAEAMAFARYVMFSEVYWNHGVRAYAAMLSAALDALDPDALEPHLWDTDAGFLAWLCAEPQAAWIRPLLENRMPYRRAFVLQRLGGDESLRESDGKLFDILEKAAEGHQTYRKTIREAVASVLDLDAPADHEIILDVPRKVENAAGVRVLPEGHEEPGSPGPIFQAIGHNFDGFARKARVLVHPRLLHTSVSESNAKVRRRLRERFPL